MGADDGESIRVLPLQWTPGMSNQLQKSMKWENHFVWIIYKVDWELSGPLPLWIQEPDTLSTVKKSLQLGWKGLDPESSHSYTAIGLGCKLRASHDVKCFFFTHLFSFTYVYTPLYI